jgi:hypothetical protein
MFHNCPLQSGLDQINFDTNVSPYGFGIRTRLVCGGRQDLGNFALQARQADIEAGLEKESTVGQAKIYFRVNGHVGWKNDFHFPGRNPHRPFKACRPPSGEQLLWVCAVMWSTWSRMPNIKTAIIAFGCTSIPATRGVDLGGVYHFLGLRYGSHGIKINFFMHGQQLAMNSKVESASY